MGLAADPLEVARFIGKTSPEIARTILDQRLPGWEQLLQKTADEIALKKNEYFQSLIGTSLKSYPGVVEGLTLLKEKGLKLAVVSNAKRRELEAGLRHTGLHDFFDLILSRDDVLKFKPDPLPYLTAVRQFGLTPDQCISVEDSPAGIESSLMGGIPSAAILSNFSQEVMSTPVEGRPDLKPVLICKTIQEFFAYSASAEVV
jgi:HAD superfamily hydrolase (TIGR01509 family)